MENVRRSDEGDRAGEGRIPGRCQRSRPPADQAREEDQHVQVDLAPSVPGSLADHGGLVSRRTVRRLGDDRAAARIELGQKPDDIGLARREAQHAGPAAANDERHGHLDWQGRQSGAIEGVVRTPVAHGLTGQEPFHDPHRLHEAVHADPRLVVPESELAVVGDPPPGAHPEGKPPARQEVKAGCLAGQDQRMPEVVGEHERCNPDTPRHRSHGGQPGDRRNLAPEVVGDHERVVAELLGPLGQSDPGGAVDGRARHYGEPEGTHASSLASSVPGRLPAWLRSAFAWWLGADDASTPGSRADGALVTVVPANAVARAVRRLDHLEDVALAISLPDTLRLQDDPVLDPGSHRHISLTSGAPAPWVASRRALPRPGVAGRGIGHDRQPDRCTPQPARTTRSSPTPKPRTIIAYPRPRSRPARGCR